MRKSTQRSPIRSRIEAVCVSALRLRLYSSGLPETRTYRASRGDSDRLPRREASARRWRDQSDRVDPRSVHTASPVGHRGTDRRREITDAEKPEFLSSAIALLMSIDWPEPFGLVVIEAMACGTPVIAFKQGSVPEIVEPGVTGLIVENETSRSTVPGGCVGHFLCGTRHA